jgi:protein SCO1
MSMAQPSLSSSPLQSLSPSFCRVAVALLVSIWTWATCTTATHARQPHGQPTVPPYRRSVASYELPNVTLVDMTGAAVPLGAAFSHREPLLVQFIFTTCSTICPVMSGLFAAVQDQCRAELAQFQLFSIAIDPEYDTPKRLQEYARQFKAGPHWRFLTGKRADIVAVQKAFDAYRGNKMRHEPITYLRASPDAPWVRLDGLMSAAELVAECHLLIAQ